MTGNNSHASVLFFLRQIGPLPCTQNAPLCPLAPLAEIAFKPWAHNWRIRTGLMLHVPTLIPPPAYAHVCPYIFRSADPSIQPESFGFLDTLGLKSIVLLSIEYPSKQLEVYCAKNHIEIHHFGIERRWPSPNNLESSSSASSHLFFSSQEINSFSVLESIVKDALELLLDVRNHPVLVTDMCVYVDSHQCGYF